LQEIIHAALRSTRHKKGAECFHPTPLINFREIYPTITSDSEQPM